MYNTTNFGKLFAGELTEWLFQAGFIQSKYQMSIYYKYVPYGTKSVVLYNVDDFLYWYTYEYPEIWLIDTLGNKFHVKLLGSAHWFMSIKITHMKNHSIPVYQAIYATSIVAK